MAKNEEGNGSPSWGASSFIPTLDNVAMTFAIAASAIKLPNLMFSFRQKMKSVVYNLEVLMNQKHQWAKFHVQLFESLVVVGLHPNCDIQALERQYIAQKSKGSFGQLQSALVSQNHSCVEPSLKPQVLLVYPPDKPPRIKYKDLHSICFRGGIEFFPLSKSCRKTTCIRITDENIIPRNRSAIDYVFVLYHGFYTFLAMI
ncbi:hypothetical protein CARUB_v10007734mg [Capsella rubella]|uniref:Uncharacterized protein n=1 Tax=Capsella rubella TaxID=81985 RepID=R0GQB7_9BRAS|nr:hypothetical protein CARUB_v10007734mg [Capsella rubella]